MVIQGIVLGHVVSKEGIEVDKAKVELISNYLLLNVLKTYGPCNAPKIP